MPDRPHRAEAKRRAKEYVDEIRSRTACSRCGNKRFDWHHDDHPANPNTRVSSLRAQGASIERIQREIERCVPLCRSCHMTEDGRHGALRLAAPRQKGDVIVPPMPCSKCTKEYKPLRKGLCYSCYQSENGHRWPSRTKGATKK